MTAHPGTGDGLEVRVTGGVVRGVREGEMLAWRGMPYAAPPIAERRFRAPAPVLPWRGIRDASAFGAVAPQANVIRLMRRTIIGLTVDEDCLSVNVHAPIREAGGSPLPVMVFIHGGGYSSGSSRDFSGQGEGFVRSGRVVYVSFNYRLGALGYLDFTRYSSGRRPFESNLGLRDQVALLRMGAREHRRLRWGCRARHGRSASRRAATRSRTLMATPSARGLFAGAIAQSPPPDAVYPREMTARWAAEYIAILRDVVRERALRAAAKREAVIPDDAPRFAGPSDATAEASSAAAATRTVAVATRAAAAATNAAAAAKRAAAAAARAAVAQRAASTQRADATQRTTAIPPSPERLLAEASADDLVAASVELQIRTPDAYPGAFCFAPVVDGDVLPERPFVAFRDGRSHRRAAHHRHQRSGGHRSSAVASTSCRGARSVSTTCSPRRPATPGGRCAPRTPTCRPGGRRRTSAATTASGTRARASPTPARGRAPVWSYRFDFAPRLLKLVGLDATHGVEMFALFDRTDEPMARVFTSLGGDEEYAAAGERMRQHWLHFAETGAPTPEWPPLRRAGEIDPRDRRLGPRRVGSAQRTPSRVVRVRAVARRMKGAVRRY